MSYRMSKMHGRPLPKVFGAKVRDPELAYLEAIQKGKKQEETMEPAMPKSAEDKTMAEKEYEADSFMAQGGEVEDRAEETVVHPDNGFGKIIHIKAEGGMVDESEEELDADASLAAAAMAKRRRMASGGEVDIREGGGEDPEIFPKRNTAALKENYESEEMDEVHDPMRNPGDPAEAAMENEDDEDMIASARRRMKMKSPMTR